VGECGNSRNIILEERRTGARNVEESLLGHDGK